MRILFITPGPITYASSRMRAHWVARYLDGADVIEIDRLDGDTGCLMDYDATIWVKAGIPPVIEALVKAGKQAWWDVCDPAWWFNPKGAHTMADLVTGVTASCEGLADDFREWYGADKRVHTIPDRLELSHFPRRREHARTDPVRFIWYGAVQNRTAIFAALAYLERLAANGHNISLTIYDDNPGEQWSFTKNYPVNYCKWDLAQENQVLSAHDIALLPPYPGAWGKVKSNNRSLTAWACGLAVTDAQDWDMLEELTESATARYRDAEQGLMLVGADYTVQESALDWQAVLHV